MAAAAPPGMKWVDRGGGFSELASTEDAYLPGYAPAGTPAGSGQQRTLTGDEQTRLNKLNSGQEYNYGTGTWGAPGAAPPPAPKGFGMVGGALQPAAAPSPAPAGQTRPPDTNSSSGFGMVGSTAPAPAPAQTPARTPGDPQVANNIRSFYQENRSNPQAVSAAMRQYGISNDEFMQATGMSAADFEAWMGPVFGRSPTTPGTPAPAAPLPTNPQTGTVQNSAVDYRNETIEGRVASLLATDAQGNYIHQNVRQAVDRANQTAAARGILNSSIAAQIGQEAAIAKAIEIAGPDAQTYYANRRANIGETNQDAREALNFERERQLAREEHERRAALTAEERAAEDARRLEDQDNSLRADYRAAQQSITANYQRQIDTINASNMEPEDKTVAIAQVTRMRDSELAYNNNMYSKMPRWRAEWLSAATPVQTDSTGAATIPEGADRETLLTIINDPAQPAAVRAAARARLEALPAEQAAVDAEVDRREREAAAGNSGWTPDHTGSSGA